MNKQRIAELVEKHVEGKTSPAEYQELLDWYRSMDHTDIQWPESEQQFEERINRIQSNILPNRQVNNQPSFIKRNKIILSAVGIAAAMAIFFTLSPTFKNETFENNVHTTASIGKTNILPGGNKAVLTLSDGSIIQLSDSLSKFNRNNNGFLITANQGELTLKTETLANSSSTKLNTLSTPRSGQYVVNLPDGSKVWLNAESSLTFPNTFNSKERKVTLTGEGYFDIAKNKNTPFIVQVDELQIEVLGTQFNINAYEDTPKLETTLVEGSLKVSQGLQSIILSPNQQSVWNKKEQKLSMQKIDTKAFTGWKDGYFVFENTNIKTIMSQLARWYDIEVVYIGNTANKEYTGRILKRSNIEEVLDMLELTGTINFEIKERRINVMP